MAAHDPEKNDFSSAAGQQHEQQQLRLETVTDEDTVGPEPEPGPELERRVKRKLDWNLVALVFWLYLLSFLDRSNIGNARIAGMATALDLTGDRYDWLLTIFYIAYIVFEFQILAWKRFPPHRWAAWVVFGWGIISTCQAALKTWAGAMVLRFLLGLFEAGFGPGIPYLLSFFYLRHEVGFRMGIFLSAAPLATCFAGALAYGITSCKSCAISDWRLLFLVEGLPTIAMTPIVYFCLPDTPQNAWFLTAAEKRVAQARAVTQTGTHKRIGGIDVKNVLATLRDPKPWITGLMYFSCNVSFSSLPVFLPTIIEQMGFASIDAQGLSAPPYFLAFLVTCSSAYLADRLQQRGLTIFLLSTLGGIGYILLLSSHSVGARYAGTFLAASGVFPSIANILPWVANNQGNDDRRGVAFVMLNLLGQVGPILGTRIYPTKDQPYYVMGQAVCCAFLFFNAGLALVLRWVLVRENRRLDQRYGSVGEQKAAMVGAGVEGEGEGAQVSAVENYGPLFRYVL